MLARLLVHLNSEEIAGCIDVATNQPTIEMGIEVTDDIIENLPMTEFFSEEEYYADARDIFPACLIYYGTLRN